MRILPNRRIKRRVIPGFVYTGPEIRRNSNTEDLPQRFEESEAPQETEIEHPPPQNESTDSQDQNNEPKISDKEKSETVNTEVKESEENLDSLLDKIYRYKHSPTAYSAALKTYIDKNYSLSLHKQVRRKFRRRPFVVYEPYEAIQADLVFYTASDVFHANSHYKYILTVIDMFSRKAYAEPLKQKTLQK